jgi:hypothetical protein
MITASQSFEIYEILFRSFKKNRMQTQNVIENRFLSERDRLATKEDIARVEGLINSKVSEAKADILKWMIVLFAPFYIGMIVFLIKQFL